MKDENNPNERAKDSIQKSTNFEPEDSQAELTRQKNLLDDKLLALQDAIREAEVQKRKLDREVSTLNNTKETITQEVSTLNNTKEQVIKDIEKKEDDLKVSKKELNEVHNQINEENSKLEGVKGELDRLQEFKQKEITRLSAEIDVLSDIDPKNDISLFINKSKSSISQLIEEYKTAKKNLDTIKGDITKYQNASVVAKQNLSAVKTELADTQAELDAVKTELADTNQTLSDTQTELDNANQTLLATNQTLDNTNQQLLATQAELDDTTKTLSFVKDSLTLLHEEEERLMKENEKLDVRVKGYEKDIAHLEPQVKSLKAVNKELKTENSDLTEINTALLAKYNQINDSIDSVNITLERTTNQYNKMLVERDHISNQISTGIQKLTALDVLAPELKQVQANNATLVTSAIQNAAQETEIRVSEEFANKASNYTANAIEAFTTQFDANMSKAKDKLNGTTDTMCTAIDTLTTDVADKLGKATEELSSKTSTLSTASQTIISNTELINESIDKISDTGNKLKEYATNTEDLLAQFNKISDVNRETLNSANDTLNVTSNIAQTAGESLDRVTKIASVVKLYETSYVPTMNEIRRTMKTVDNMGRLLHYEKEEIEIAAYILANQIAVYLPMLETGNIAQAYMTAQGDVQEFITEIQAKTYFNDGLMDDYFEVAKLVLDYLKDPTISDIILYTNAQSVLVNQYKEVMRQDMDKLGYINSFTLANYRYTDSIGRTVSHPIIKTIRHDVNELFASEREAAKVLGVEENREAIYKGIAELISNVQDTNAPQEVKRANKDILDKLYSGVLSDETYLISLGRLLGYDKESLEPKTFKVAFITNDYTVNYRMEQEATSYFEACKKLNERLEADKYTSTGSGDGYLKQIGFRGFIPLYKN